MRRIPRADGSANQIAQQPQQVQQQSNEMFHSNPELFVAASKGPAVSNVRGFGDMTSQTAPPQGTVAGQGPIHTLPAGTLLNGAQFGEPDFIDDTGFVQQAQQIQQQPTPSIHIPPDIPSDNFGWSAVCIGEVVDAVALESGMHIVVRAQGSGREYVAFVRGLPLVELGMTVQLGVRMISGSSGERIQEAEIVKVS